jgi:hypothetical protein
VPALLVKEDESVLTLDSQVPHPLGWELIQPIQVLIIND